MVKAALLRGRFHISLTNTCEVVCCDLLSGGDKAKKDGNFLYC